MEIKASQEEIDVLRVEDPRNLFMRRDVCVTLSANSNDSHFLNYANGSRMDDAMSARIARGKCQFQAEAPFISRRPSSSLIDT